MRIAIPKEVFPGEQRVAATPASVARLRELGFDVVVEAGAGVRAAYPDAAYAAAGAGILEGPEATWQDADLVLKVCPPAEHPGLGRHEAELIPQGATLVSFVWPAQNGALLERLAARGATVIAMDQVPRVTRAQKMDALSSMANIAGYRAVIEAAHHFGRTFAPQITAAGSVPPATVLVIGAGVAGLASIAAAKGLGARVRAFDTRAAAREQVESLGAEFLEVELEESGDGAGGYAKVMSAEFLAAERKLFTEQAREVDIVITTALIPGKPAPKLWEADMVSAMTPGSVVVDLASVQGGNCELTRPGEVVVEHGVTIVGHEDFTSRMATTASQLYATNLMHLVDDISDDGVLAVDMDDDVIRPAVVTHAGVVCWPPPPSESVAPSPAAAVATGPAAPSEATAVGAPDARPSVAGAGRAARETRRSNRGVLFVGLIVAALWIGLRVGQGEATASPALAAFMQHLTVFVLACFVGWQVIWNVSPALHTPLMSVTNAISGIIILGGLLSGAAGSGGAASVLGVVAVLFATINVAGGFLVTQRMLRMFRKR